MKYTFLMVLLIFFFSVMCYWQRPCPPHFQPKCAASRLSGANLPNFSCWSLFDLLTARPIAQAAQTSTCCLAPDLHALYEPPASYAWSRRTWSMWDAETLHHCLAGSADPGTLTTDLRFLQPRAAAEDPPFRIRRFPFGESCARKQ